MKIIKPSVEFFGAVPTDYNNAIKFIEKAGRTCYKSEDKITNDSAEGFVRRLINAGHLAMVEHSNFVVKCFIDPYEPYHRPFFKYLNIWSIGDIFYIGGNLTAWLQEAINEGPLPIFEPFREIYSDLFGYNLQTRIMGLSHWQVCPHDETPRELHRYSAKFICDRGVSHELVRHRPCSFAQESTRYVNYGGKNMEFVEPTGFEDWDALDKAYLKQSLEQSEWHYNRLLRSGMKPQQARAVLPNALKTEIVVTADAAEWAHIRKLRTAPFAHPDMQRVMNMIPWEEFI